MDNKIYLGTYKVYRVFKKSNRREVIKRGLSREDAKKLVNTFKSNNNSMVVFDKQFTADKYYL